MVGICLNTPIFLYLQVVTNLSHHAADNKQYFKQKVAIVTSLVIQLMMIIINITIGGVIAGNTFGKANLVTLCVWAIIAG